jgi:hypothetical protein
MSVLRVFGFTSGCSLLRSFDDSPDVTVKRWPMARIQRLHSLGQPVQESIETSDQGLPVGTGDVCPTETAVFEGPVAVDDDIAGKHRPGAYEGEVVWRMTRSRDYLEVPSADRHLLTVFEPNCLPIHVSGIDCRIERSLYVLELIHVVCVSMREDDRIEGRYSAGHSIHDSWHRSGINECRSLPLDQVDVRRKRLGRVCETGNFHTSSDGAIAFEAGGGGLRAAGHFCVVA